MELEELRRKVADIVEEYGSRDGIEDEFRSLGFELWGVTKKSDGRDNPDEQVWGYERGSPNGRYIMLVNWIQGFLWIYEKRDRVSLI